MPVSNLRRRAGALDLGRLHHCSLSAASLQMGEVRRAGQGLPAPLQAVALQIAEGSGARGLVPNNSQDPLGERLLLSQPRRSLCGAEKPARRAVSLQIPNYWSLHLGSCMAIPCPGSPDPACPCHSWLRLAYLYTCLGSRTCRR